MIIFFLLGWNKEFDKENSMASQEEKEWSINTWKRQDEVNNDLGHIQLQIILVDG